MGQRMGISGGCTESILLLTSKINQPAPLVTRGGGDRLGSTEDFDPKGSRYPSRSGDYLTRSLAQ